jgi:disulfide bond formation protein DsbB
VTHAVNLILASLAVVGQALVVGAVLLFLASRVSASGRAALDGLRAVAGRGALGLAGFVAVLATAGSLYYSEVAGFVPCTLCWYQRIAMYPLIVLIPVAALRADRMAALTIVPISGIGLGLSFYHHYLERFQPEGSQFCQAGAPCTVRWIWEFNYISIPILSMTAFALITTLALLAWRREETA